MLAGYGPEEKTGGGGPQDVGLESHQHTSNLATRFSGEIYIKICLKKRLVSSKS